MLKMSLSLQVDSPPLGMKAELGHNQLSIVGGDLQPVLVDKIRD